MNIITNNQNQRQSKSQIELVEQATELLLPSMIQKYRHQPDTKTWLEFTGKIWEEIYSVRHPVFHALFDLQESADNDMQSEIAQKRFNDRFLHRIFIELQQSLAVSTVDFDNDPILLNTPGGAYNLETLSPGPNRLEDFCCNITGVAPEDDEDGKNCPNYMANLFRIAQGDTQLVEWLEDISGYFCTGLTSLHEFYWFFGNGYYGGGKVGLAQTWHHALGTYADFASLHHFGPYQQSYHTERDFRLASKRLIIDRWVDPTKLTAANKLASHIYGEPLQAREVYGKMTTFKPIGKILFTSSRAQLSINAKVANDERIMQGLRSLQFPRIVKSEHMNGFAEEKLYPEAPFILNRMMKHAQKILLAQTIETPVTVCLQSQRCLGKTLSNFQTQTKLRTQPC